MATKTDIQATITALTDGGLNTAAEVRSALTSLMNEYFPNIEICTHTTPNKISRAGSNTTSEYEIEIKKVGNTVFLQGIYTSTGSTTSSYFLEVTDDVYKYDPGTKAITQFFSATGSNGTVYQFSVLNYSNGKTRLNSLSTIPSGVSIYINIFYNCND